MQTAKSIKLMFFYRHVKTVDVGPNVAVVLLCKCFSKSSVETQTIFEKYFRTEREFHSFLTSRSELIVPKNSLKQTEGKLIRYNIADDKRVVNRSLVISQTNIFSLLNKSFAKCGSDPVKWYIYTAARLVVGDQDELPHTFTNLKAVLTQYHSIPKARVARQPSHNVNNASDDIFAIYKRVFGGDRLLPYIDLVRECVSASSLAIKRLGEVYDSFNSDRDTIASGSVSFANLQFYDSLSSRFKSVLDVIMSSKNSLAEDESHLKEYKRVVETVNDRGCKYIKEHLRDTARYVDYDPSVHTGYTFDKEFNGNYGLTETQSCGRLSKDVLRRDLFPNSMSKCIKGTSVYSISNLCNSDKRTLMNGDKVKEILREKHGVPTDTAFMAVPSGGGQNITGFQYCRLINPVKLDCDYHHLPALKEVKHHVKNPSMATYNRYSKAFRTGCPKLLLNEVINPKMTVFLVSLDVDDKEMVKSFYSSETNNAWAVREKTIKIMEAVMAELVSIIDPSGYIMGSSGDSIGGFSCNAYESKPDTPDITKVGLRFVFKFRKMIFKDSSVVSNFIRAFKFFVFRRASSIGCAIDEAIYGSQNGHCLRLPMMGKAHLQDRLISRQLLPLFTACTSAYLPSSGLVHAVHSSLRKGSAKVLTHIGDISDLVKKYSPRDAEFNLLRKKNQKKVWYGDKGEGGSHRSYTEFFKSILHDVLLPAVWACGGGDPDDHFEEVKRQAGKYHEEYTLVPSIRWCTIRHHTDTNGNPCRYFIQITPDDSFSLCMYCFGCGVDRNVYVGKLPSGRGVPE